MVSTTTPLSKTSSDSNRLVELKLKRRQGRRVAKREAVILIHSQLSLWTSCRRRPIGKLPHAVLLPFVSCTSSSSQVTDGCFRRVVVSVIHWRLDFGNVILRGLQPIMPIFSDNSSLQYAQSCSPSGVRLRRYDHINGAIAVLHW